MAQRKSTISRPRTAPKRRKNRRHGSFLESKTLRTIIYVAVFITATIALWDSCRTTVSAGERLTDSIDSLQYVVIPDDIQAELINYPGFNVSFNASARQPNWVAWELTADEAASTYTDRKSSDFAPDPDVKGCPELSDYRRSGFSRGHMAPAADMRWSQKAMDACFLLTNISPQDAKLNGGAWGKLEDRCRVWAARDSSIIIICGPVLSDRLPRTIGKNRIPVPERFFKVVLAPYATPPRGIGFIMPNTKVEGGIAAAAVSIDEVEAITGFDFFSSLPDDIENRIESECNFPLWNNTTKRHKSRK